MANKRISVTDAVRRQKGRIGFWRSGFPNMLGNLCLVLFIFLSAQFLLSYFFELNIFDPDDFKSTSARIPELGTRRVVDEAGVLTQSEIDALTAQIDAYEAETKGQMAVLIIKTLHGDPIEEFSMAVAEKWKIGRRGEDDGVLLLLAVEDRESRLEIGYGLEGVINDARAGDILRGMSHWLQGGFYAQAISYAISSVSAFVRHEDAPEAEIISRTKLGDDDEARKPYVSSKGPEDTWFLVFWIGVLTVTICLLTAKFLIHPDAKKSVGLAFMLVAGEFALRILIASGRGGRGGGGGRSRSGGGGGSFGGGGASGRW